MPEPSKLTINEATPADVAVLHTLIGQLAAYERLSHAMVATISDLRQSLFGPNRHATALVARLEDQPVGYALFFRSYSTFLARAGVYLEDLFVVPEARGRGIGKRLLHEVAAHAVRTGAGRLEWAVLDWNEPAIGFYRSLGAEPLDDWTVFRLSGEALSRYGGQTPDRTPVIETARLTLRPGQVEDAERVAELLQAPEIEANLANLPWPYTRDDAQAYLRASVTNDDACDWLMATPADGVIGSIHLSITPRHRRGYLGFWVGRPYWGNGYAPEAIRAVIEFGLNRLGLERIEAEHFDYNLASGRAMLKGGMVRESVRRAAYRKHDRQVDVVVYAVTAR